MSLYKLDSCPEGINTRRLTRVVRLHELVACFTSYQDGLDFVAFKEAKEKEHRTKSGVKP